MALCQALLLSFDFHADSARGIECGGHVSNARLIPCNSQRAILYTIDGHACFANILRKGTFMDRSKVLPRNSILAQLKGAIIPDVRVHFIPELIVISSDEEGTLMFRIALDHSSLPNALKRAQI